LKLSVTSVAAFALRVLVASFGLIHPSAAGQQSAHAGQLLQAKADATKKHETLPAIPVIAPPGSDL